MRLSGTAAILFIGAVGSAQDLAASAASHRKLNTHVEYPAVRAADDVITADATGRHDDDFREDAPVAGQQCTPSPLWSTDVDPDKYEIGCEEVEVLLRDNSTFAGDGKIRTVRIASYDGRQVAVKTLCDTASLAEHRQWLEVVASDAVNGRSHVVHMLGFCGATVVAEAYSNNVEQIVRDAKEPLPIEQVVSMSLDAAIGLRALHEAADAPIVHFDIKIDQLLVRDDGRVSLGDFNSVYFMGVNPDGSPCPFNDKNWRKAHGPRKSPEYVAHEYFDVPMAQPLTEKMDIYRMGLVYEEILSAGSSAPFVAREGGTLWLDPAWPKGYIEVIRDMLGEVERRPSAADLVSRLQGLQEELFHTP